MDSTAINAYVGDQDLSQGVSLFLLEGEVSKCTGGQLKLFKLQNH